MPTFNDILLALGHLFGDVAHELVPEAVEVLLGHRALRVGEPVEASGPVIARGAKPEHTPLQ